MKINNPKRGCKIKLLLACCLFSSVSDAQLSSLWVQNSNPSTSYHVAYGITTLNEGVFVVGFDQQVVGDAEWRIEKRNATDGTFASAFGLGGVVVTNPSANDDVAHAVKADASGVYIVGKDNSLGAGNDRWHIEKRDLVTGALITAFGTGGVITSNPSTGNDVAYNLAIDASGIYVIGSDNTSGSYRWRIEKRNLTTGSLIATFGTGGVVTSNPSSGNDTPLGISIETGAIYVAGYDQVPGDYQIRLEKRNSSTGVLVSGFGISGVVNSNPSAGEDIATAITIGSGSIYITGYDNVLGNYQWRTEKRNLITGSLISAFGSGGVVNSNPSAFGDMSQSIVSDTSSVYVGGYDLASGDFGWRVEKINPITGALIGICNYIVNPSSGQDFLYEMANDSSGIYLAGVDNVTGNSEWRIEKLDLCHVTTNVSIQSMTNTQYKIFPNPVSNNLELNVSTSVGEPVNVEIYNMVGKLMLKKENIIAESYSHLTFDVSEFPDGIYVFVFKTKLMKEYQKFIKN